MNIPINTVVAQKWFDDAPTEPGYYWFYGEPWMGEMGGHYTGKVPPENRLMLVEIKQVTNGIVGISSGQFMNLRKWDGKQRGFFGKWTNAIVPDVNGLSPFEYSDFSEGTKACLREIIPKTS
tara:strand:- start:1320 stop:1685 length:366 start_codon:yes stop_codon:yes gene_type:complete